MPGGWASQGYFCPGGAPQDYLCLGGKSPVRGSIAVWLWVGGSSPSEASLELRLLWVQWEEIPSAFTPVGVEPGGMSRRGRTRPPTTIPLYHV